MLIIGTDRIHVRDQHVCPAGDRHAVDADGRALCHEGRPRFVFPALTWEPDVTTKPCPSCLAAAGARAATPWQAAYPMAERAARPTLDGTAYPAYPAYPDGTGYPDKHATTTFASPAGSSPLGWPVRVTPDS
jgi:hypothetical protein